MFFLGAFSRRGGSGDTTKWSKVEQVACFENRYSVAVQTLRQAQGADISLQDALHVHFGIFAT